MKKPLRPFRAILAVTIASFAASAGIMNAAPRDVLFIAVDDLNDWTGYLGGHPQATTPHIDRLVARGMAFTNSHCAAPACNPSRAALMSGLRPWQTGIYTNGDPAAPVLRETLTINRHFLASGYRVLGGGKIYHGLSSEGRDDTWTEWAGIFPTGGKGVHNLNGLDREHFDWGPLDDAPEDMGDYKLTDWAIDKLQNAPADKPLFLAVGYIKPHLPWYVPKLYFDRFPLEQIQLPEVKTDDLADIPPAGVKMAGPDGDHAAVVKGNQWRKAVQGYLATISFLDDQVGRLLDGLDASPRGKEMIIVWWTDHGWHLGEKEHWRKFALWEDATRTSMAIVASGVAEAGGRTSAPVDYLNLYPTVCELAGVPVPGHVKGRSLVPLLRDPEAAWDQVAVCTHGRGNHAAIERTWRLIRYADGGEELYDHESDPREWNNVAGDPARAEIKARLLSALPAIDDEVPPTQGPEKAGKAKARGEGKGKDKRDARDKGRKPGSN